jgi:predicted ferric reductase
MRTQLRAGAWVVLYLVLAVAPLPLSLINLDPGRGLWVNFSVALGFLTLSLMGLQFVLAARFVRATRTFGFDRVLQVHRQMTVLITIGMLAHPLILFVWDSRFLKLLNLVDAPMRAKFAVISVLLTLVLIATSMGRRALHLSYQVWQLLHVGLAVLIVVTALLHVLLIGYYVDQVWEKALWIAYSAAFIWIGLWVRVFRPLLRWRRRWRVVSVEEQPGPGHRITIEPLRPEAYGGRGFRFRPGQFAWISAGHSPFSIDFHPFSISSSAESPNRLQFIIKAERHFTARVHTFQPGDHIYLDGPWGHFSSDRYDGPGYVFIGGGVGVTPLLSMLSTMADRGESRPCWAILGNRYESSIVGRVELDALLERLDLVVVHTLSAPEQAWTGHRGRIDATLLADVLPSDRDELQYFICGSDAMMAGALAALRELGIPEHQVHAEQFAMV